MNVADFIIIIILLFEAMRGVGAGIMRSLTALAGFWGGLLVGAIIAPLVMRLTTDTLGRVMLALFVVFGFAFIGGSIGRVLGSKLRSLTHRLKLQHIDAALGGLFSAAMSLFIIWLLVSTFSGLPSQEFNKQLSGSKIIRSLDKNLPPAPAVLSQLANIIDPNIFPQVFVGPEPAPAEPVDPATQEDIDSAVAAAGASTVKLESAGCGGLVFGSGFVVDTELIMTNAHVVAGIQRPTVIDANGRHRAETIFFDPELDIAVLRVEDLAGKPLNVYAERVDRGTKSVVLGYPAGGDFKPVPAGVRRHIMARGRNIYGGGVSLRSVYELNTTVVSGNSGGPLVLPDGTVIGVIFARSDLTSNAGYAITSDSVIDIIDQSRERFQPTNTGRCVAG